jgi:hypothetical protein
VNVSNFSGLGAGGTNWYQFDTTYQVSNVLAYTKGSHQIRGGFDLAAAGHGPARGQRRARAVLLHGRHHRYSVADFMLGLPRTVIPPTDQIQGHVGGWRNGFFVNDVWQASRNLTLSLGLRYERNSRCRPTRACLDAGRGPGDDHPLDLPAKGFEFHEPNNKDIAPRLGATYRLGAKTVLRAGFGIYYNPNQMKLVHLPDQQPAAGAPSRRFTSDPANPTLSFSNPFGTGQPAGPAGHDLADARASERAQGPVELRRAARDRAEHRARPAVRRIEHQPLDRSFFNNTPQPGPGAVDPRRPSQNFRSRRIIQNDLIADYDAVSVILHKRMSRGIQADVHYTWSRTRDMATHSNGGGQTMNNYDIWRTTARPTGTSRTASWRATSSSCRSSARRARCEVPARRLADRGRDHAPERHAGQHHVRRGPRQHRHRGPAAAEPGRRGAEPQLRAEQHGHHRPGAARAVELLRPERVRAARSVHVRQHPAQRPARPELEGH